MTVVILAAVASLVTVSADTTWVMASRSIDLTADGREELLELVGTLEAPDSVTVRFTIRSPDRVLYEADLAPLTRRIGYDRRRGLRSREEYRTHIAEFGSWFLSDVKFMTAMEFEAKWRRSGPLHLAEIPAVIARDSALPMGTAQAAGIWDAIRARDGMVFEYSPGGDGIVPIAWSLVHERFFRLVECC